VFKAQLHETKFEFDKEEKAFQLLLRLDSTNVRTLWAFAYFLAEQNKTHEATYYYEKALALVKTPELKATFLNNLGNLYHAQNDYPKAAAVFNAALEIYNRLAKNNPQLYELYAARTQNNLGTLYADQND
jgi:tetratricopeptide (TPR) repeat protein